MLSLVLLAASNSLAFTAGLVVVFFVVFPALVTGLLLYAFGQALGERRANREYPGRRGQDASRG